MVTLWYSIFLLHLADSHALDPRVGATAEATLPLPGIGVRRLNDLSFSLVFYSGYRVWSHRGACATLLARPFCVQGTVPSYGPQTTSRLWTKTHPSVPQPQYRHSSHSCRVARKGDVEHHSVALVLTKRDPRSLPRRSDETSTDELPDRSAAAACPVLGDAGTRSERLRPVPCTPSRNPAASNKPAYVVSRGIERQGRARLPGNTAAGALYFATGLELVVQVGCIRRVEGHESRLLCPTTVRKTAQSYRISSVLWILFCLESDSMHRSTGNRSIALIVSQSINKSQIDPESGDHPLPIYLTLSALSSDPPLPFLSSQLLPRLSYTWHQLPLTLQRSPGQVILLSLTKKVPRETHMLARQNPLLNGQLPDTVICCATVPAGIIPPAESLP
jgi:hypothetical protein